MWTWKFGHKTLKVNFALHVTLKSILCKNKAFLALGLANMLTQHRFQFPSPHCKAIWLLVSHLLDNFWRHLVIYFGTFIRLKRNINVTNIYKNIRVADRAIKRIVYYFFSVDSAGSFLSQT